MVPATNQETFHDQHRTAALVLRGRPRPVVRFRRGVVLGLTGSAAVAVALVAWLALEPPGLRLAVPDEASPPLRSGLPDAVAGAPGTYGDVPELGPPLPGDLGRPILEHQRSLAAGAALGEDGAAEAARAAASAERERRAAEVAAARGSPLMVQRSSTEAADAAPVDESQRLGPPDGTVMQDRRAGTLEPPGSPWTLTAGTVIPASLLSGLDSGLPGLVVAQVTENVRDSATGRAVLVPQGARLVGRYDSASTHGQRRAMLVWQRIVMPDGSSVTLEDMPATDRAGYAGLEDAVDFHTGRLLRGIAMSTLLGVGTEAGLGDDEGDLARAMRESAQDNAARAGDRIIARDLEIMPTLTVRPGWPVRALVHKDLVLAPWRS